MKEKIPVSNKFENDNEKEPGKPEEFNVGRVIKLVGEKVKEKIRPPEEKIKKWKKMRNKVLSSSLAGMVFLGSYFADYKKVYENIRLSPENDIVSIEKNREKFYKIFPDINPNLNEYKQQENLTKEDYWFILSQHFNEYGMQEIVSRLNSVEIKKSNVEVLGDDQEDDWSNTTEWKTAAAVKLHEGTKKYDMIIFDGFIKNMGALEEAKTILHEIGHIIGPEHFDLSGDRSYWYKTWLESGYDINEYPASISEEEIGKKILEDFAESFAEYLLDPKALLEKDFNRFTAMENYIARINETNEESDIFNSAEKISNFLNAKVLTKEFLTPSISEPVPAD